MTTTSEAGVQRQTQTSSGLKDQQRESITGWLTASPAIVLLLGFLIIPFLFAFVFAFTNQRLISPNPTEFVGLRNFERLLTVKVLRLEPVVDEVSGEPVLDEEGNYTYPRVRNYTRNNPEYPQYDGLQEWTTFTVGETQYVLLAGDAVFMKSLVNTFYFTIFIVLLQGGLGLVLALLINARTRGVNIFRTIYFMPVVVSMVVVSILWSFIYDGQNGLLNNLLAMITFGHFDPVDWLGNPHNAARHGQDDRRAQGM